MTALYDSFDKSCTIGMASGQTDGSYLTPESSATNTSNAALAAMVIPGYLCPSASDTPYQTQTSGRVKALFWVEMTRESVVFFSTNWFRGGRTHYVPIHGALLNAADRTTNYNSTLERAYAGGTSPTAHYAGCTESCAPNGIMPAIQSKGMPQMYIDLTQVSDGTTNTIMISEDCASLLSHWGQHFNLMVFKQDKSSLVNAKPYEVFPKCATGNSAFLPLNIWAFHDLRSMHPAGVNSVYGDGRVSMLSSGTDLGLIRLLLNRKDGEMVVLP
jgi:hypothetical protein